MAENLNTKKMQLLKMVNKRLLVEVVQFTAIIAAVTFYFLLDAPIIAFVLFVFCLAIAWFRFEIYKHLA